LVGAGPGDPGWITVRGLELLRQAEVVVFDALANPLLLDEAPATSEKIDVGKRARDHKLSQDQINQLLVDKAREGKRVVRLKGGDPYLFGRGAEELIYCAKAGVACEVVPGITSGIAAPLAAGIPVTHREVASTLTLVTGHEDPTKGASAIDYRSLAGLISAGGTVCFYMGVGRLKAISDELQKHGLAGATPVALIQWGATPKQRSLRTTLAKADEQVRLAGIGSPAIIVVGPVAAIQEPGLDFYMNRPLFGRRVLVTRTRQQASTLKKRLAELGAEVLEAPTVELVPPSDWSEVDRAIRDIGQFDWVVLTSGNGVRTLKERLDHLGLDARHLAGVRFAAVGETTEEELRTTLGIKADLVPTRFVAESLAGELISRHDVKGKRVLLLRADIARPALPKLLSEAGAQVTEVTAYQTKVADALPEGIVTALREKRVDWVTFTSASTAQNLAALLGDERALLASTQIASIGPITSDAVRELGLEVAVEAEKSNIEGLMQAIVERA
jgi:uroporphyrinogen III methyltransferase/synthase